MSAGRVRCCRKRRAGAAQLDGATPRFKLAVDRDLAVAQQLDGLTGIDADRRATTDRDVERRQIGIGRESVARAERQAGPLALRQDCGAPILGVERRRPNLDRIGKLSGHGKIRGQAGDRHVHVERCAVRDLHASSAHDRILRKAGLEQAGIETQRRCIGSRAADQDCGSGIQRQRAAAIDSIAADIAADDQQRGCIVATKARR